MATALEAWQTSVVQSMNGLGYYLFDLNLEVAKSQFTGIFDYIFQGPYLNLGFRFYNYICPATDKCINKDRILHFC